MSLLSVAEELEPRRQQRSAESLELLEAINLSQRYS